MIWTLQAKEETLDRCPGAIAMNRHNNDTRKHTVIVAVGAISILCHYQLRFTLHAERLDVVLMVDDMMTTSATRSIASLSLSC